MFFAGESERSGNSKFIIGGVAAIALIGAAYVAFAHRGVASDQVNTADSAVPYVCLSDGYSFTLTPAQFEKKLQANGAQSSSRDGRGGVLLLKCPQCGQFAAVRAAKCPKDGALIPLQNKDGTLGKCPKCGASPLQQP